MANGKVLFNDMLGSTLGSVENGKFSKNNMTLFGESLDKNAKSPYNYFTGKPNVEGLGYAFLFRNYRPELAKWQTQDPMSFVLTEPGYINKDASLASKLGYPDGWNNLAYCNNWVTNSIDWQGTATLVSSGNTGSKSLAWPLGTTGFATRTAAIDATAAFHSQLHNSLWKTITTGTTPPQFAVADEWDYNYVINKAGGLYIIQDVSVQVEYSIYE